MNVNIRAPLGEFGSLPYCARILEPILRSNGFSVTVSKDYDPNSVNILIDETISSVLNDRKAEIWWTDTPGMKPLSYHKLDEHLSKGLFVYHIVTSEFMKEHCNSLNIPVDDVIYRPINPIMFTVENIKTNHRYDLMTIGKFCICDRKRIILQRNLVMKHNYRYCAITDGWLPIRPHITKLDFGKVSDLTKANLLSISKFFLWTSFVEGFGMPVLEAMAVGTPPIYSDCPAHNEFAEGIPIPTGDPVNGFCYGTKVIKFPLEESEVEKAVEYALNMTQEEYEDLSEKCREKAREVQNSTLNKIRKVLIPMIDRLSGETVNDIAPSESNSGARNETVTADAC